MRDLLFKNLTSTDRRRKVISSSETIDKDGVRSTIHRHFVCIIKETKENQASRPLPYLYVLKEHDSKGCKEKFFCRIKGSVFTISSSKLYLILFTHSLKIELTPMLEDSVKFNQEDSIN